MDPVGGADGERNEGGDVALCPGCMEESVPGARFCAKCGMPIGMVATLDPLQSIHSAGWLYRRAISGGRRRIALCGMWLLFGPALIAIVYQIYMVCTSAAHGVSAIAVVRLLLAMGLSALYAGILYRMTRSYVRDRRTGPGTCKVCGYDLSHLPPATCPECGTSFEPADLEGKAAVSGVEPVQGSAQQQEEDVGWRVVDISCIPEAEFPIDCETCGWDLAGTGERGECPKCGTQFERRQRLVDTYGPEIFVAERCRSTEDEGQRVNLGRALFCTALGVGALLVAVFLVRKGYMDKNRQAFALLLLLPAILEWIRVLRIASQDRRKDEKAEHDDAGRV